MEFTRGPANVDDLITFTLDKMGKELTEQWLNSYTVTRKMQSSGHVRREEGGNSITEDLEYQNNDTVQSLARNGVITPVDNQIATQARFSWKVIGGTIVLNDFDVAKNSGSHKRHGFAETKLENLRNSFSEKLEGYLVSAVTPDAITPTSLLDVIDAADPALGSYGDIARATYTWWQAYEAASGSMVTQGLEDIQTAHYTVSRGGMDPVSYHMTTQVLYQAYQRRIQSQEHLVSGDKGDLEFTNLSFAGKPIFWSPLMASGTWLGINQKYLKMAINSAMEFKQQPWVRLPGAPSQSKLVETMLEITCSRPASNFKLTGMTA